MPEKKNEDPKNGEFIDLESSNYKKKNNFVRKFTFFIIFGLFFISIGFFSDYFLKKQQKENDALQYEKKINLTNKKNSSEEQEFVSVQEEKINNFLESSNLIIKDTQKQIEKLKLRLSEIEQTVLKLGKFSSTDMYAQDIRKYSLLLNFMILKNKYQNREKFGEELNRISFMLVNENEINGLISYFRELDIKNLKTKNDLLFFLNKDLEIYEEDLKSFFYRLEKEAVFKNKDIFESKESFMDYLKEIINSTFKVTRFKDDTSNNEENLLKESYKKTLSMSKEYLLIGNFEKSIEILRKSNLKLDREFLDLLDDSELILVSNEKLQTLETKIYRAIGSDFD